ncbi:MAG TPA: ABC transporter permease [Ilumatobacter sp.]|nr:ABC transporter permease [Ilumatobacter sp.]
MSVVTDIWSFITTADNWSGQRGIWSRTVAHMWISLVATLLATAVALPVALTLAHRRLFPVLSVAVANIGRAVPSFAIIVIVLPLSIRFGFGLGFWPTTCALVALGIPPIFTNTYAGIAGAPPELVEAATGVGMTGSQVLRLVELPVAMPLVFAGFRLAAVQIVATATLGALVGYQCLGSFILEGIAQPRLSSDKLYGGAFLVALLAVLVEFVFGRIEPRLVPWRYRAR